MQMANLAEADVSEEDKIRVMMNQSSCEMMKWVFQDTYFFLISTHYWIYEDCSKVTFFLNLL